MGRSVAYWFFGFLVMVAITSARLFVPNLSSPSVGPRRIVGQAAVADKHSTDEVLAAPHSAPKFVRSKSTDELKVTIDEYTPAVLRCCFEEASPPPTIVWERDRTAFGVQIPVRLPNDASVVYYNDEQAICSTLTLPNVTRMDATEYRCIADNTVTQTVTIRKTLVVNFPPCVYRVENPNITAKGGEPMELRFKFQAPSSGDFNYQCRKNGLLVKDTSVVPEVWHKGSFGEVKLVLNLPLDDLVGKWELKVYNSRGKDKAAYCINAWDACGPLAETTKHSHKCQSHDQFVASADPRPPACLKYAHNFSTPDKFASYMEGHDAGLVCCFSSPSRPVIKWGRLGSAPLNGRILEHDETGTAFLYCSSLVWDYVTRNDLGKYFCSAKLKGHRTTEKVLDLEVLFQPEMSLCVKNGTIGTFLARFGEELSIHFALEMPLRGVDVRCTSPSGKSGFCPWLSRNGYSVVADLRLNISNTTESRKFLGTWTATAYHPCCGAADPPVSFVVKMQDDDSLTPKVMLIERSPVAASAPNGGRLFSWLWIPCAMIPLWLAGCLGVGCAVARAFLCHSDMNLQEP